MMKLNTAEAKKLIAVVLGDAPKATRKAALKNLLELAGEAALKAERDREDRDRRMWGTPTHGW